MRSKNSGFFIVFCFVFCLAFLFALAGCQLDGSAESEGQRIEAENTRHKIERTEESVINTAETDVAPIDDAAITATIKAEILSDPWFNVSQVEVTTTNGVVKLRGTVNSQQTIDEATKIAHSIKEVKTVDNALVH